MHRRISDPATMSGQRLLPLAANWRCRPKGAAGTFQVDRPVHSVNGRSPITSRNRRHAGAVIRGSRPPTATRSRLNDCIRKSRPDAADPLPRFAVLTRVLAVQRFQPFTTGSFLEVQFLRLYYPSAVGELTIDRTHVYSGSA